MTARQPVFVLLSVVIAVLPAIGARRDAGAVLSTSAKAMGRNPDIHLLGPRGGRKYELLLELVNDGNSHASSAALVNRSSSESNVRSGRRKVDVADIVPHAKSGPGSAGACGLSKNEIEAAPRVLDRAQVFSPLHTDRCPSQRTRYTSGEGISL